MAGQRPASLRNVLVGSVRLRSVGVPERHGSGDRLRACLQVHDPLRAAPRAYGCQSGVARASARRGRRNQGLGLGGGSTTSSTSRSTRTVSDRRRTAPKPRALASIAWMGRLS